jgi:hypothetical protein
MPSVLRLLPLAPCACTSSVLSVFPARQVVKARGEVVILLLLCYCSSDALVVLSPILPATRDQMKDMFDIDANRTKLSPRKKRSGALRVRHAAPLNPASATSDKPEDKYTSVSTEKMAQLPSLFPPVTSSLKTPRGNMSPWTPRDPTPGDAGGLPARDQLR